PPRPPPATGPPASRPPVGQTSRNCCRCEEPSSRSSLSCPPYIKTHPQLPPHFLRCARQSGWLKSRLAMGLDLANFHGSPLQFRREPVFEKILWQQLMTCAAAW